MGQQQRDAIDYLREDNRVLREQLGNKRLRLNDDQRRRLAGKAKTLGRRLLREVTTIVPPETLRTWHQKLMAKKHDGNARPGPGRPRRRDEIRRLVVRMATEIRDWGYRRIQGALANLGHEVARGAIEANRLWMGQVARNLCDDGDGFLMGKGCLIHHRDPLFTAEFLGTLAASGVKSMKLPPRSPHLNLPAEGFVRTIKQSCLDRMILFAEGSLRKVIHELVAHYQGERNHEALGNRLIIADESPAGNSGAAGAASGWAGG